MPRVEDNPFTHCAWTTYLRATYCQTCGKRIEAGEHVWGTCYDGRSLTDRLCDDCHDARETRIVNLIMESKNGINSPTLSNKEVRG